jgi:hypothetical protein
MAGIDWNAPLPTGGSARRQSVEDMFPEVFGPKGDVSDRAAPPGVSSRDDQAPAPPPAPRGEPAPAYRPSVEYDPNASTGDYLAGALKNAPGSAAKVGEGLYNAAKYVWNNPSETAEVIGKAGVGLLSKANTALGGTDRYEEGEKLVDVVWNDAKGRWENPAKTFHDDPFAISLDVATVAPGIGMAGRAAGLGKLATGVEKVAALGDPVNLALQGAKLGTKAVTRPTAALLRYPEAVATGVPLNALKIAEQSGRSADPAVRGAFRTGMKGSGDPREIARTAVSAMEEKRRAMSNGYVAQRGELTTQELPMTDIRSAFNDAMMAANRYGTRVGTPVVDALKKMDDKIRLYEAHPDAGARTAVQLDLLKRDLNDIVRELNPSDRGAVASVPKSVRDTIATVDGKYADMMDYWQNWIATMRDLQSTLGTGDRVSETARLAKLMSTMKNNDKLNLLKQLEDTPSGKNLKEMIAGAAFKDIMPPAMQGFGLGILGPILAGGPHGMAAAAAASPRLAGLTQYGIGRTESLVNAIPKPPAVATNVLSQIGQEREGRKSGGRVSKHEADADQLVRAAERAKKGWSAQTEPLLNQSDEAVAKALEVANRSI